jgi:hypothetical protein
VKCVLVHATMISAAAMAEAGLRTASAPQRDAPVPKHQRAAGVAPPHLRTAA